MSGEGSVALFNRIEPNEEITSKRIISYESSGRSRSRSRSPANKRGLYSDTRSNSDVKNRLGNRSSVHSRLSSLQSRLSGNDVRSRLGRKQEDDDNDRVLDRQELESQRPVVQPWDVNPEIVPRGRNYFEVIKMLF